jgi:hypothetical protein
MLLQYSCVGSPELSTTEHPDFVGYDEDSEMQIPWESKTE